MEGGIEGYLGESSHHILWIVNDVMNVFVLDSDEFFACGRTSVRCERHLRRTENYITEPQISQKGRLSDCDFGGNPPFFD